MDQSVDPSPVAAPPTGRDRRRARIALLLTAAFLVGGISGAGARALTHRPVEPYATMATPSSSWSRGATQLWSVPLPAPDEDPDGSGPVRLVTTPGRVAVLQPAPDGSTRVTALALTSSTDRPEKIWEDTLPAQEDDQEIPVTRWWGDHLVSGGRILPSDDSGDSGIPAPPVPSDGTVHVLPDDLLLVCSSTFDCSALDAGGRSVWEHTLPGPVSDTAGIIREGDGHVVVPVLPGSAAAQVLDATTGDLTPFDMAGTGWDTATDTHPTFLAFRDGWVGWSPDGTGLTAWDASGKVGWTGTPSSDVDDTTVRVASPGGTATTADALALMGARDGTPADALVLRTTPPVPGGCTTVEAGTAEVGTAQVAVPEGLRDWVRANSKDGGSCAFDQSSVAAVSGHGRVAVTFLTQSRGNVRRAFVVDAEGNTIPWVSGPLSSATLARPDLLLTVDEGGTALTGWGPAPDGTTAVTGESAGTAGATPAPSPSETSPAPSAPANPPAPTVAPTATGAPSSTPSGPPTPTATAPVEGAHPGAGGPIPADAVPVTAIWDSGYGSGTGLIVTPSGNIGCDLTDEEVGCGVHSLRQERTLGQDNIGSRWFIWVGGSSVPEVMGRGDAPGYMLAQEGQAPVAPQVVPYGQVVTFGRFACASEDSGMTCWDSTTGHGAFLNRRQITGF